MPAGSALHILNGDALADRLAHHLGAESDPNAVFVMREALVEGPVAPWTDPHAFAEVRASHLRTYDPSLSAERYRRGVDPRGRLDGVSRGTPLWLWFEYDVFCQVNLWFTCACIDVLAWEGSVSIVLPPENTPYSFAHVPTDALLGRVADAVLVPTLPGRLLWESFVGGGSLSLPEAGSPWHAIAGRAVAALQRWRSPRGRHRPNEPEAHPHDVLVAWYAASGRDFGTTFRRFCEQYPEYGFGDVQVRGLLT